MAKAFFVLLIGAAKLLWPAPLFPEEPNCPFCKQDVIKKQEFYEGTHIRALYNYMPHAEGHCMILPIRHVQRIEDLTEQELSEIFTFIPKLNQALRATYETQDFVLILQNGQIAGQTVPHAHFHIIPRKTRDVYEKIRLWAQFLGALTGSRKAITPKELEPHLSALKQHLASDIETPLISLPNNTQWTDTDQAL